jgi:hypothetical protein
VIASWAQELKRLEDLAAAIGERHQVISHLIGLYRPPAPRTTKTTKGPPAKAASSSKTRPNRAGATSLKVISQLPIGAPGITQRDLQTRLPGIRANVIGRIVENAAAKGQVVKDGERYWRPERHAVAAE